MRPGSRCSRERSWMLRLMLSYESPDSRPAGPEGPGSRAVEGGPRALLPRTALVTGAGHPLVQVSYWGQAASICLAMVATGVVGLLNQLTIDFHSWPAPTAAGIASEASNAKVAAGSARYFADSWSMGSV